VSPGTRSVTLPCYPQHMCQGGRVPAKRLVPDKNKHDANVYTVPLDIRCSLLYHSFISTPWHPFVVENVNLNGAGNVMKNPTLQELTGLHLIVKAIDLDNGTPELHTVVSLYRRMTG
jgi:hypothetical protein